jgi:glycerol 3-phosphatase-2
VLRASDRPLWDAYDLAVLDLDGVVYVGRDAVPGAAENLARATASGQQLAYVTNNASRPPRVVAAHLRDLGLPARESDVVTSAQAAARLLSRIVPTGAAVFVIGGDGLFEALEEQGLVPVQDPARGPAAVVSGYHPDLRWRTVMAGAVLVQAGLPWVASNTDWSVPTPEGRGPGNGVLVDAVARFTGRQPEVAGKPQRPLFDETRRRVGGSRPLVVGDRLDTDIEGAHNAGLDSLLVLTGVTGLAELVDAAPHERPTYIAPGLAGLGRAHPAPEPVDGSSPDRPVCELRGWRAAVDGGTLRVEGGGDPDDWWRAVAAVAWSYRDASGRSVDITQVAPPG